MTSKLEFAAVVDIGSTKITALAGEKTENGRIRILGQAMVPSRGIKRGIVMNPDEFSFALKELLNKLEIQTGERIGTVNVSMAGMGIHSVIFEGTRYIESGIVTQGDLDYLEREASHMPLEPGHRIYHMFSRNYEIGDDPDVRVPVGHEGRKLTARYTIVAAPASYQESLEKALSRIGVRLGIFTLSPLAIAEAVTNSEERDLGVVVMDIGGGTTKMTSFLNGKLIHMAVIPFGGEVITRDIKEAYSILLKKAEQLKVEFGQAIGDFAEEEKFVSIPAAEGWEKKEISFRSLAYIIQARMEEIIDSMVYHIEKSGFLDQSAQGIVLTGGSSKMVNMLQLVKFRTGMDARLGFSQVRLTESPDLDKTLYLGALGMLKIALRNGGHALESRQPERQQDTERNTKPGNRFFSSLKKRISQQIEIIFEEDETDSNPKF